jgi:hypothetical protein
MPKWSVALHGDLDDLKTLADLGVGVTEEPSGFLFRHSDLDKLMDGGAVREQAIQLVEVLNGLGRLARTNFRAISAGGVSGSHAGGTIKVPAPGEVGTGVAGPRVVIADATGQPIPPPSHFAKWFAVALRDPIVHQALHFFAAPTTSTSLWKVYEIVRDDAGGKAPDVVKKGWATAPDIERFRSVHYPSALGGEARHGVERKDPPAPRDPMSLAEGEAFVRGLLEKWLASK